MIYGDDFKARSLRWPSFIVSSPSEALSGTVEVRVANGEVCGMSVDVARFGY